jgi:hypothetical protein
MTKHVWHIITGHSNLLYAHCLEPDCKKELNRKEIECRVNATERLSAEDARQAVIVMEDWLVVDAPLLVRMKAYADTREGGT